MMKKRVNIETFYTAVHSNSHIDRLTVILLNINMSKYIIPTALLEVSLQLPTFLFLLISGVLPRHVKNRCCLAMQNFKEAGQWE